MRSARSARSTRTLCHRDNPTVTLEPVRVAVIPAAGLGTRFLPVSKTIPKEMLPLVDTPIIDNVISEAVAAG